MITLTLIEVKNYLRVDFDDDDELLKTLMTVADEYLKSAISKNYDNTSQKAKILTLITIQDLYDNRGISEKTSGNVRKLISDFALQLQLESSVKNV